jgi:hypothetical protein
MVLVLDATIIHAFWEIDWFFFVFVALTSSISSILTSISLVFYFHCVHIQVVSLLVCLHYESPSFSVSLYHFWLAKFCLFWLITSMSFLVFTAI